MQNTAPWLENSPGINRWCKKATFGLYLQQKEQINTAQFARDHDKSASMTGSGNMRLYCLFGIHLEAFLAVQTHSAAVESHISVFVSI